MAPPVTSGLVAHLDAQAITGLSDGDPMVQWEDQSGNGNHADPQNSAVVYNTGVIAGAHPAVRIPSGLGRYLEFVNGGMDFGPDASMTMFVVFHPLSYDGNNPGLWRSGTGGGSTFMIFQGTSGRPWIRWGGSDILNPGSGFGLPLNEDHVTVHRVAHADTAEFFANGALEHSASHSAASGEFTLLRFGFQSSSSESVDGYYAEILFYNRDLTNVEREDVEGYLLDRWSLLPDTADPARLDIEGPAANSSVADQQEIEESAVWTWFADPRAIRHVDTEDRTYVGYNQDGDIVVGALDHNTGDFSRFVLRTAFNNNDHANPVLRVRSDGRLQVFWSAHNGDEMFHRTSTNPEDISAWDAEQSFNPSGNVTYPNPVDLSDRVVLHWRRGPGGQREAVFAESTDDGATWGTVRDLFLVSNQRPYLKCVRHPTNEDRIDYVLTHGQPSETDSHLYHCYREGEQFFRSDGTLIGDFTDLPLGPADVTQIWDAVVEGEDAWQWDIAYDPSGRPVILFAGIDGSDDNANHRLLYATFNGTSWSVNDVREQGKTIAPGQSEPAYTAGAALDHLNSSQVWVSVEKEAGDEARLYLYSTDDEGTTWTGEWAAGGAGIENIRPVVPRGRTSEAAVLWLRGTYDHWTSFDTDLYTASADVGNEAPEDLSPEAPVLEASADGTAISASTSPFVSPIDADHKETLWEGRLDGSASDWSDLVIDEVGLPGEEIGLETLLYLGAPANETIHLRATHVDEGDRTAVSNVVTVETGDESVRPDQPVLSIEELFTDSVRTSRTAFSHPEGTQDPPDGTEEDEEDILPWHLASRYEIRDRATQTTVLDTGFSSEFTDLEQLFNEIGDPEDELEIRVTDQDGKYGLESEPSEWVPFDLLSLDALRPETPTITVDVCDPEATEVSGDTYVSQDSPASAHAATRWWVGVGPLNNITWRSVLTEDAAELTSFTWPHLPPGVWRFAVSYKDEEGRWSERGDPESCEIERPPAQPFITDPMCSGLVDSDLDITWEMLTGATDDFEYTGELAGPLASDAVADDWTELFNRQTSNSHTLDISGLEDGEYVFRVQACILSEGQCGEYAYLTVTIDRSGEATLSVPYNFADLSSLPATWDQGWDTDDVTFALVDKTLKQRTPYVGILANVSKHNAMRMSILRFNELGEPTDMDATIVMAWVPRDTTWYGWRFAYTQWLHGGLGWRILNADETGSRISGVIQVGHGGGPLHPFPSGCEAAEEIVCPCKFVTDGVCAGGTAYNAIRQEENPGQLIRYGRGGTPGWRLQRRRPGSSVSDQITRTAQVSGDPAESTIQARQAPEDDCDKTSECEFDFTWYVQRFRIRRETSTHTRFQAAVLGPGIDPAQGWHLNELVKTKELGLLSDDEILCGPCGLAFRHMQNLTQDHGVLFRCARFTIYDDEVSSGPILGAASLVED